MASEHNELYMLRDECFATAGALGWDFDRLYGYIETLFGPNTLLSELSVDRLRILNRQLTRKLEEILW